MNNIINIFCMCISLVCIAITLKLYISGRKKEIYLKNYLMSMILFALYIVVKLINNKLQFTNCINIAILNISFIFLIHSMQTFISIKGIRIWKFIFAVFTFVFIFYILLLIDYKIIFLIYSGVFFIYLGVDLITTKKICNYVFGVFFLIWGIHNVLFHIICAIYGINEYVCTVNKLSYVIYEIIYLVIYILKVNISAFDNKSIINILNKTSIGIEYYNSNGELTYINTVCLKMFGILDEKDIMGVNLFDRFNISITNLKNLVKGEHISFNIGFDIHNDKLNTYENGIRKKYLEVNIYLLGENTKKPDGYIAQIQDVSQHIYLFNEREETLKKAVRSANLYRWDWNINENDVYVDPKFAISLGYNGEKFNGRIEMFYEYIKEEDRLNIHNKLEEHFRNNTKQYTCEWRIRDIKGKYIWYMGTGSVIEWDEEGSPKRIMGINQCIEERKQSELKLLNSDKRYRSLFETMVNGYARLQIIYGDNNDIRNYICVETNSSLKEILKEESLEGKTVLDIIHNEKYWIELINNILKNGDNRIEQYSRYLGKILEISMHKFGENQILLIIRDVTNERNLENMVRQTEKLTAIGQLAGGIAHDFNNQLMAISGAISIIKAKDYTLSECKKYIEHIQKCSDNSAALVKRLLAFSRESEFELLPIDIHSIIKSVVEILERSIDKKIKISTTLNADKHMILGDESQIQNTLLNIGINARDALEKGGEITIETYNILGMECERDEEPQEQIQGIAIAVTDTGIGMTSEVKERLFEPFFTTKDIGKGTGMGLAMVFSIIKNHGGCISVNSIVDVGTDFIIKLPITDNCSLNEVVSQKVVNGIEKIMVVDDEPIIRELIKEMLEILGYEVITFGDGQEALYYYKNHISDINLVLLDIVMPGISGKELFEKLYQINKNIKVGFLSGYGIENIEKEITEKVVGFINKPVSINNLSIKIREMLDK